MRLYLVFDQLDQVSLSRLILQWYKQILFGPRPHLAKVSSII